MTTQPLFSIVVPVYKVEKYLSQCIDSLLAQDFKNYEIILIDDGSPDKCPEICDDYANKCNEIKVVHKINGGLSDARNKGIEVATGKYITFVDSDDFWIGTDVLSGIESIIQKYSPDIIVSDFIKYYTQVDKYIYPRITCSLEYNGRLKTDILKYLFFCHADMKMSACQKFAKRELLTCNTFTKDLLSEDIDWSFKLYSAANSICVYDKPYYCYRQQREGSITNTASAPSFNSLMYIIDKWHTKIRTLPITEEEKQLYSGYLAYQLCISMPMIFNLEQSIRPNALQRINNYISLFDETLNSKTIKVKKLIKLIGLKNTCFVLYMFLKLRVQIHNIISK